MINLLNLQQLVMKLQIGMQVRVHGKLQVQNLHNLQDLLVTNQPLG